VLVRPPYCYTFEQIGNLTRHQLNNILFRPDEDKNRHEFDALTARFMRQKPC
jgi:hypothetical protein